MMQKNSQLIGRKNDTKCSVFQLFEKTESDEIVTNLKKRIPGDLNDTD
ncbi:MAG TPA: hypothetical protein VD731_02255 [Nitrosopumilaceae archaeon]|nr:hypothetical protein [Nitrosopumilaceae archaeon]